MPAPVVDIASFNESVLELSKGKNFSIGRPVIGALTKAWIISLRYAVRDSAGKLRFILIATIPLSSPQSVWKDVALPEGMGLGLVRDDGYLVSRYPMPAGQHLTEVYGISHNGALMNHLQDKQFPVSGHVEGPSLLDGVNYLFVFRRLSNYPLSFYVIQPLSKLRALWWSNVQIPFLLMLLLLAGGYGVFRWALRAKTAWETERNDTEKTLREMNLELDTRIQERTKELSESERFARASLDALSAHIAVLDSDGRIISTNLAWREFAEKNGRLSDQVSEGADYLTVCRQAAAMGDEGAAVAATLIQDLIDGVRLEGSFEYPCHAPKEERWFVCRGTRFVDGGPVRLALAHENITARKLAEQLQSAEKIVLEALSEGRPLAQILDTIVRNMELLFSDTLCSILLLDTDGLHLRYGAAPSLPEAYTRAADEIAIGPSVGSCGTAAYRNEQVIVTDIATDPLWANYAALALPLGLRACWSTPVRSGAGKVLGTFALYYREPRSPSQANFDLIERWTHLTGIAIERKHAEDEIRMLNDNLEQRIAERTTELEASRAEIAAVLESLADAIVTCDERGTVLAANPALERIFGYAPAELVGHNVLLLMHAPHRAAHDAYLQGYLQIGEARIIGIGREVPGRHKNGDMIPIHLAVSEYWVGDRRYFTGTLRDLRHEKTLTAELRQFRDTLDQALDCIFMFCPDMLQFTYVNKGAVLHIGYSAAELLQMQPFDLTPESTEAHFRELMQPLVDRRQQSLRFETMHRHKNGHDIPVETFVQFVDGEGRKPMFVAVVRDITERKQADQALIVARDAAQLANRAKDSFLATTSHEIRTPLGGLMGMLELLSLTPLNEEQRETLLSARDSGRSLLRILEDLLDWSKIEAGKLELAPQPTSVAKLVAEVVKTYARVASPRGLVLGAQVDARLSPALLVDPMRLSQVLNNFVSNALKFTRKGAVEVRAELLRRREGAEQVRFSVKDTGIGIEEEVLPRLFQSYGQGSAETARMYGGTGLGLAICRRLADLLDGRIEVESAPGRGSTFSITLTLPVSEVAVEETQREPGTDASASVSPLVHDVAQVDVPVVLVVDDHPTNRRLLARQLGLLGLRTETAQDGETALSMWRDGRFAMVITDCHMPKMDGYALAREIRRIEAAEGRARAPLIGWTANALPQEEGNCIAAGMDHILVKPAELAELKAALSKWLTATAAATVALGPIDAGHDGSGGTAGAPIDLAALDKIATNRADQAEILGDFMVQTRADFTELEVALHAGDLAAIERLAHRMKGACRMVGARELEAACEALQEAARQGNAEDVRSAHAAINRAIARLERHLA